VTGAPGLWPGPARPSRGCLHQSPKQREPFGHTVAEDLHAETTPIPVTAPRTVTSGYRRTSRDGAALRRRTVRFSQLEAISVPELVASLLIIWLIGHLVDLVKWLIWSSG